MAELTDSFEVLADGEMWVNIVVLGAGFMSGTLIKNTVEGRDLVNLPDESYGIGVVLASYFALDGDYQRFGMLGGGLYTVDKAAQRFGIKSRVEGMGA